MEWLDKLKKVGKLLERKTAKEEYFLALILKEKSVKAVIWEEKEGHVAVLDSAAVSSDVPLEEVDDETRLRLADEAIGLAEKNLPENVKTTKTIFGINDWWVEGSTIKEPYFGKIKKLTKELELTPLGFVVIPEGIAHALKLEEGIPPTVLLVFVGEKVLGVTLVQAGRIEKTKTIPKEETASQTASAIIKSFGDVEVLPSRIILFDGEASLEETKQEFIAYPWTKDLSFLHFPKIDILPKDFDTKAVVWGAAKEMGLMLDEEIPDVISDVKLEEEEKEKGNEEEQLPKEEEETFGFVQEQDVLEGGARMKNRLADEEEEDEGKKEDVPKSRLSLPSFSFAIPDIGSTFGWISSLTSFLRLPNFSSRTWLPFAAIAFILLILTCVYIFIPKARITLVALGRSLENDIQITADTQSQSIDKDKQKIPAIKVETKHEGEKSQKTTGKKQVGDKAKGEVTIYNKTENKKTFPKGTVLTGPNNLRFTLDDDTSVASTAAFELTPSNTKAKITADQIGEESNIAANTNLPFKEFPTSSYFAKNDSPLTGGTKRDVAAVSKEDQDSLLTALTDELREKGKQELTNQSGGNKIVDIAMKEEVLTKKFNKDVGDEADSLTLTLSISFSTLSYKDSDLLELVGSEIEKAVPDGFAFQKDTFETSVKNVGKEKSGNTTLTVHYKATLLPKLDIASIKSAIVGKSKPAVEKYLDSLPLEDFAISQTIQFPPPLNLLPQRSENIIVEIKSK